MWKRSLLIFLFSLSVHQPMHARTWNKFKKCFSLHLSATTEVRKGQEVTLSCLSTWESHQNKSPMTYQLFRNKELLKTKTTEGETVVFNISISTASELGTYKCKAQILNCTKYSNPLNFTLTGHARCPLCLQLLLPATLLLLLAVTLTLAFYMLPKYRARKAKKENAPRGCENEAKEIVIYANVKKKHREAGPGTGSEVRPCVRAAGEEPEHAQEIHYATPMFPDTAPVGHDGDHCKTDHVYCELVL